MRHLLLAAVLVGMPTTAEPPPRRAWIIYQEGDFHSDCLRKEWRREWCHSFLREEIRESFDVRWVPLEQTTWRVRHVPLVVLDREEIELHSCGSSGASLQELRDVLVDFRDTASPLKRYYYLTPEEEAEAKANRDPDEDE